MHTKLNLITWLSLITVMVFFSFALVITKLINVSFYLLVIFVAVILLTQTQARHEFWLTCKKYWPLHVAMVSSVLAVFIHQVATHEMQWAPYDLPSRLAAFVAFFWLFLRIPVHTLQLCRWGFAIGAIVSALQLILMAKNPDGRPTELLVWYVELTMLLGVFSFLSIGWNDKKKGPHIVQTCLLAGAGLVSMYAVYLSQTRNTWIAIPVFFLIAYIAFVKQWHQGKNLWRFLLVVAISGAVFFSTDIAQKRIDAAKNDVALYLSQTNANTSLGLRFQVWKASWQVFTEHPFVGVGKEHYEAAMNDLARRNLTSKDAAMVPHSHNELLYNLMTLGIVGFIATLLLYIVPAYFFARELRQPDIQIRTSAAMGLSLCVGYMVFGLVDVMLKYWAADVFYGVGVALFWADIVKRKMGAIYPS